MIEIADISKTYHLGETPLTVLRNVSLTIREGEFVAVMGPSGSGKSTLLHVLGLLDTPDSGSYRLAGQEVTALGDDELARLRSQTIGFIFQQFNLLPRMDALQNVELPQLYGQHRFDPLPARDLLAKVGLQDRMLHRPNQLSGGQQQRVAIARALVNRPRLILADEPTGNLDSHSAQEIMDQLHELNAEGITVVIVTHEEEIARRAKRLVRVRDGVIQSDEILVPQAAGVSEAAPLVPNADAPGLRLLDFTQHFYQGFRALAANKIRAGLSMLGILIGVAAVVAMLALGHGAQQAIERQLSALGSNLLMLRPGAVQVGGVALEAGAVTRMTPEDVRAIKEQIPGVREASPAVQGRGQVSYRDKNWSTQVQGVGPGYAVMRAATPDTGRFFTEEENRTRRRVAVIGKTVVRELFGAERSPLGELIKINKISFQVIGILPERGATGWRDQDDQILIPLETAMHRLLGKDYVDYIDVEVRETALMTSVQDALMELMLRRHRVPPSQQQDAFTIRNMADIQKAFMETSRTMNSLLASIATISLLVGGIGIMNIMLVSVTERTREIGLRKAIGARRRDVLLQFLAEAIVVSVVGGVFGIVLGWAITQAMARLAGWPAGLVPSTVLVAFIFSAAVGIVFGLYPARQAARLNPIDALRHE